MSVAQVDVDRLLPIIRPKWPCRRLSTVERAFVSPLANLACGNTAFNPRLAQRRHLRRQRVGGDRSVPHVGRPSLVVPLHFSISFFPKRTWPPTSIAAEAIRASGSPSRRQKLPWRSVGRRRWGLPYHRSHMSVRHRGTHIRYTCQRQWPGRLGVGGTVEAEIGDHYTAWDRHVNAGRRSPDRWSTS